MQTVPNDNQGKWTYYQISEARKQLQTYYSDQQNQQMTRLIGFVIGLFALLQLTTTAKESWFVNAFPYFSRIIEVTSFLPCSVVVALVEICFLCFWKVGFLFAGTAIIMYFIFRTIFRYSLYGNMACNIMTIKDYEVKEFRNNVEYNELLAFNTLLSRTVYNEKPIFGLPASWFFGLAKDPKYPSHERCGIALCISISVLTSLLLLLFLW
jgi:hypothetical protein